MRRPIIDERPPARRRLTAARSAGAACLVAAALASAPSVAATFKSLYAFSGGDDGANPYGQLVADSAGLLYGTTDTGGAGSGGTVFRFDPVSGALTTLYAFTLGGATGSGPASGVIIDGKGILYGTTERGGTGPCAYGCGTVFKLDPSTRLLTTLATFDGAGKGDTPEGLLLYGGQLYGETLYGGYIPGPSSSGYGTLFKVNRTTKTFVSLHSFNQPGANDGANPHAALVPGADGRLYGVASSGGANGSGTVFAINPTSAAFSVIHAFDYHVDGSGPIGRLRLKLGKFIGTTVAGGPTVASSGVVYSVDPATGILTNLYSFGGGNDGLDTQSGVVGGPKGLLYGVTTQGGVSGAGTLYSVNPTTHAHVVLHQFAISDGASPSGEMLLQGATTLFGVTSDGGHGTIYQLAP
jgi:uncharacterized repeat protein (TIGR03803 family)